MSESFLIDTSDTKLQAVPKVARSCIESALPVLLTLSSYIHLFQLSLFVFMSVLQQRMQLLTAVCG